MYQTQMTKLPMQPVLQEKRKAYNSHESKKNLSVLKEQRTKIPLFD